jgi:serine/threonine-protein kinase
VVYAAEHALIGRAAAVKVLLPEFSQNQSIVARFFNEAKAATTIRHPGIVEIYDFGWHTDGSAYIVMEYLQGETLGARRARVGFHPAAALAAVRQIAGALGAAHGKGIVHRDLKPDNVFIVPDPEVPGGERIKLLDFGIAKLLGDQGSQSQTRTGSVIGTPAYMAPEQCRGVSIDHRADLYSLGVILFELCASRPPFVGEGSGDVLAAHIHLAPPLLSSLVPGVPAPIDNIVTGLLAKSPADRPQTAEQLIQLIDTAASQVVTGTQLALRGSMPVIAAAQAPTTLSGAAQSVTAGAAGAAGGRSRAVLTSAVAAVVIVSAVIAFTVTRSKSTPAVQQPAVAREPAREEPALTAPPEAPVQATATAPSQPITPAPPPTTIDLTITSTPAGADVLVDGTRLGTTPYTGTRPKVEADITVTIRKAGFKDKLLTASGSAAIDQSVKLDPKPRTSTGTGSRDRDQSVNPF